MARYSHTRLSAQDNSFLLAETENAYTHVTAVQVFDMGNLRTEDGGVDFGAIRYAVEASLHKLPRYRQKLLWTPFVRQPVWVDDPDFSLDYHMRHTSLPKPGGPDQLKRLAARIMSQRLDRARPLWETWVVEGLEGDRFAMVAKIHHCMIDGSSGVDISQILLSLEPEQKPPEPPRYMPNPAPNRAELLLEEARHRAVLPFRALRGVRQFRRESKDLRTEIAMRARVLGDLAGFAVRPASMTPINGPLGPHRRFDWTHMRLDDVKAVRKAADCSVNDVVLTTVSGALREYMQRRNVDPSTLDFRISAPVSTRRPEEKGKLGNRVSSWIVRLPLEKTDPLARLHAIAEVTQDLKRSKQALGIEMIMQVAEWTPPVLLSLGARVAQGPINCIVTNVPGPQFPLYMLGAKLLEMHPVVPLLEGTGLGFAIFSYDGKLFWGFNADYALVPDVAQLPRLIQKSFLEFADAVNVKVDAEPSEAF